MAYVGLLKETQSQDRQRFVPRNPLEEEDPTKIPLYRCIKSARIKPQTCAPCPFKYVSFSHMCYTQVCVCVCVCSNYEHTSSI